MCVHESTTSLSSLIIWKILLAFLEGIRVMQTLGLTYKNMSSLQHSMHLASSHWIKRSIGWVSIAASDLSRCANKWSNVSVYTFWENHHTYSCLISENKKSISHWKKFHTSPLTVKNRWQTDLLSCFLQKCERPNIMCLIFVRYSRNPVSFLVRLSLVLKRSVKLFFTSACYIVKVI